MVRVCSRRACKGVAEVASAYYGQFPENSTTSQGSPARVLLLPAVCPVPIRSLFLRESVAIARKLSRKIRWDKPVSDYREDIARGS